MYRQSWHIVHSGSKMAMVVLYLFKKYCISWTVRSYSCDSRIRFLWEEIDSNLTVVLFNEADCVICLLKRKAAPVTASVPFLLAESEAKLTPSLNTSIFIGSP